MFVCYSWKCHRHLKSLSLASPQGWLVQAWESALGGAGRASTRPRQGPAPAATALMAQSQRPMPLSRVARYSNSQTSPCLLYALVVSLQNTTKPVFMCSDMCPKSWARVWENDAVRKRLLCTIPDLMRSVRSWQVLQ